METFFIEYMTNEEDIEESIVCVDPEGGSNAMHGMLAAVKNQRRICARQQRGRGTSDQINIHL